MLAPPSYAFTLPPDSAAYLPPLEYTVPGAVVWMRVGRSWQPQRRVDPSVWPHVLAVEVRCSMTCAWLTCAWLEAANVPILSTREAGTECVAHIGLSPEWYVAYGRTVIEAAVERGELKPHAAERVTSYQLGGAAMMATRPAGLYRWPPGCITGDAELVVSRGGCVTRMSLKDLVFKFNGGTTGGRTWPANSITFVQSVDKAGVRRVNRVMAAYASGVKRVFCVETVEGHSLRATADHRFSTPSGWKTLRALQAGPPELQLVHVVETAGPVTRQRAVALARITDCGDEETFDLTMAAPMHNFVANRFVVHNSGKTFGALAAVLSRPGPVLVICPSMARKEWRASGRGRSSVDKFTNLETHVILPTSQRPVHYEAMVDYVRRMGEEGKRPVVVVGMEALADHQKEIQAHLDYRIVVIDELHMLGDPRRWSVTALQDGGVQIEKAKTKGDGGKRNVAAMELLHSPRVELRLGLTGTPLEDGRPRRLWAPGDLLLPGAFGRYSDFRQRYCGFHRNEAGYMDDGGASHVDELRQRWSFVLYDVPRSVTHAELPPLRIEVAYLAAPDRVDVPESERQNKPDAMLRELKALEKAASGAEATGHSFMRRREGRLAEAASRVRNACRLWAKEYLDGTGKVMVLLTRHKMVEAWADYWATSFPGVQGWAIHGDNTTEKERDAYIEAYAEHPGPCWLIGTGDSIGTSKDGMQCSDLGIVAQLPAQPGRFIQWIGRWDRLGGKGTNVRIPVAEGTEADKEIARLVRKFGPIERFLEDEELRVLARKLSGLDREGILDEAVMGMLTGSEGKEEWED